MLSQNALTVLEKRYLVKDSSGTVTETVEDLFMRVASSIAQAETHFDSGADTKTLTKEFYDLLTNLEFLPNSPTLMNAGRPIGQLSACFVLPIEDSMEKIFEAIKQAALIHKSGGGTGFSFSRLRPSGSSVNTTGGVASGPISFMRVFNMATEAVKQGGTRRGANMGILRIDHPDILAFINCKADNADITNFNISIGITEEFMQAVEAKADYNLVDPSTNKTAGTLNAREVFDKIVMAAWHNGEPGIIFLDRLNRDNVVPSQGEIESTNPCGEQPLLPFESCNLGSINLTTVVENGTINWDKLKTITHKAVHFLDNVIEVNKYPLPEIEKVTKSTLKIGLGVMGWADMLLLLGISYNSPEAVHLAEQIMNFITTNGREASAQLAKTRGAFPLFEQSIYAGTTPLRNGTITTIAPTGTLSIIANCSSGVEPVFGYVYVRNVMDGTEMIETNPILKSVLLQRGIYSDELMKRIASEGTLAHIDELPEDIKSVFICAHDVTPEAHINMQAAFQKFTDNAVSKTVNFSNSATPADVEDVYMRAYKTGCKGVTIYRDGSRSGQVLNIGDSTTKTAPSEIIAPPNSIRPRPRPEMTMGVTERVEIGCGNLYVTVNYDDQGICEVFTSTGKAGGCPSQSEATARLATIAFRSGISTEAIVRQLRGIRCPSTIRRPGMKCTSCPDAIASVITRVAKAQNFGEYAEYLAKNGDMLMSAPPVITPSATARFCPECGEALEHEGGCVMCRGCGYSKCG